MVYVFYANLLYGEYPNQPYYKRSDELRAIPAGCYLHYPDGSWYMSDFTPVLLEDVPKELRLQILLLT